ncbi:hypothetical protein HOY80DRAFT_1033759 [Tuber brumale]|nr:hypothetical protein HOY80DRAFT_1033759 [Tuber brumale]
MPIVPEEARCPPHTLLVSRQYTRPNTINHYCQFAEHATPIPAGQLKYNGWQQFTRGYPDTEVIEAILGICQFGAKIGYEGYRTSITIHPNLSSALDTPELVSTDIAHEIQKNRLECYDDYHSLPPDFTASPLENDRQV